LNLKYFRHHTDDVSYTWNDCAPDVGVLYRDALVDLLGAPRKPDEPLEQKHKDIARSVQAIYEKAFFALLQALHKQHPSDHLALAGGCAMNSVANGKVYRRTPFKKMYLPAAAGDAGGAIGAAVFVQTQLANNQQPVTDNSSRRCLDAYLGPESSEREIQILLDWKRKEIAEAGCAISFVAQEEDLLRQTAQAIADGKVIGWFQGRMEWGPRALGNRSILADPRRANMKKILNAKIKRRESFRPFAPSILREAVSEWHKETNPRYYRLIEHFRDLTGIPLVLNTSFNENEPVVCYCDEALDCFLRTKMDVLVLGNFCLERKG
jgi:carbamoyltransferase